MWVIRKLKERRQVQLQNLCMSVLQRIAGLAPVPACNDRLVDTPTPSEGDATSGDDTAKTTSAADEQIDCATLTDYDCDAETHCRTLSAVDVDILPGDEYCSLLSAR